MKTTFNRLAFVILGASVILAPLCLSAKKEAPPEISHDGLHKVAKPKNSDLAYLRPGVDFSEYNTIKILEPYIAFNKNWQDNYNSGQPGTSKVSSRDMERMIARGKELFTKEFEKVLEKKGYPVVTEIGEDTLIVRPAIINLEVNAPDPNNTNGTWNKIYTDGAGFATFYVEFFDGPSSQILGRAVDSKGNGDDGMSWRIARTRSTNTNDARNAFNDWATAIANGLDNAKKETLD